MEIRTVRFGAFKSLYDVACPLDHLTVLTGPNGSGKSNFVEGLNFLSDVYEHGLEFAVSRAGGFDNVAFRRTQRAKRPLSFEIEVGITESEILDTDAIFPRRSRGPRPKKLPLRASAMTYRHAFALKTSGHSIRADYEVTDDRIELLDAYGEILFSLTREDNKISSAIHTKDRSLVDLILDLVSPFGDEQYSDIINRQRIESSALISEQMAYPNLFWQVRRLLSAMQIFQLSPYQVRSAGVPTPNARLERHGENLPGAADYLMRNDRNAWRSVQRAMRTILPDLVEIVVIYTEDRRLALKFRERGSGRPWATGEVSDGTIQALALFIALFDSRIPMLVIEEPENSVHPWILRRFLDMCREASGKQLVLTTHSPVLLNYVKPDLVRLAYLSDARTHIVRLVDLSPEYAQLVRDGEVGLFETYDSGAIVPAVPRGLSPDLWIGDDE